MNAIEFGWCWCLQWIRDSLLVEVVRSCVCVCVCVCVRVGWCGGVNVCVIACPCECTCVLACTCVCVCVCVLSRKEDLVGWYLITVTVLSVFLCYTVEVDANEGMRVPNEGQQLALRFLQLSQLLCRSLPSFFSFTCNRKFGWLLLAFLSLFIPEFCVFFHLFVCLLLLLLSFVCLLVVCFCF